MPAPTGVSSELLANPMFQALVGTDNANLPYVNIWDDAHDVVWPPGGPMFTPPTPITTAELISCYEAIKAKLQETLDAQNDAQRITNADYSKTLVGMTQVALQGAVQFLLGKDQAYFLALKTQADAMTARMQNERLRMEVMLLRAQFAATKLSLAVSDSQFGVSEVQRVGVLPAQVQLTSEQYEAARAQTLSTRSDSTPLSGVLGGQIALVNKQILMVHEQMEGQRAQTLDTRQDSITRATTVTNPDGSVEARLQGLLGVQNFLYRQQITSYRDDSKIKSAKLFSDLWMTQKTMDDGTLAPKYAQPPSDLTPGITQNPFENVFQSVRQIALGNTIDTFVPPA